MQTIGAKSKINFRRLVLMGLLLFLINMIIGNLLYQNPLAAGIYAQYQDHPTVKSFDFIGGVLNWVLLTNLFGLVLFCCELALYLFLYPILPGGALLKGFCFGVGLGLLRAVPEAFNQWMLLEYPGPLILMQLLNTFLGYTLQGMCMGPLLAKGRVLEMASTRKGGQTE